MNAQPIMRRPVTQHTESTVAVRNALTRNGYSDVATSIRYAEFHEHDDEGRERHAVLYWDVLNDRYRHGDVFLWLREDRWVAKLDQEREG